jgi:hypothetical protein
MLPADVELLIRDSIDVYLKAQCYRPPRFGQRLLAQSFAGETIQPAKVAAVTAKEIEAVSSGLVTAIKNVIEKVPVNPYEGLQNDLLQVSIPNSTNVQTESENSVPTLLSACQGTRPHLVGSMIDWKMQEKRGTWS